MPHVQDIVGEPIFQVVPDRLCHHVLRLAHGSGHLGVRKTFYKTSNNGNEIFRHLTILVRNVASISLVHSGSKRGYKVPLEYT